MSVKAVEMQIKLPGTMTFHETVPVPTAQQAKAICESKYPNAERIVVVKIING